MAKKQTEINTTSLQELVNLANEAKTDLSPQKGLSADDLAKLDGMSKEELISLIKRVSGAMWGIGCMSDDEAYEAARLKCLIGGLSEKEMWKALPGLKEWFDRTKGKPSQSVNMTVKDDGLGKLATEKLIRLAAMLDDPVLITPLPSKID